jgi:hypothetical protein
LFVSLRETVLCYSTWLDQKNQHSLIYSFRKLQATAPPHKYALLQPKFLMAD